MDTCPACGTAYRNSRSNFCQNCGAKRPSAKPNVCTNPSCENHDVDLGEDSRYCDICGAPTSIEEQIQSII